jgi:hypothetical protein
MPLTMKKRPLRPWSPTDLKMLKSHAGKQPAGKIAKQLKRTEGAVRQKAMALGISLRLR